MTTTAKHRSRTTSARPDSIRSPGARARASLVTAGRRIASARFPPHQARERHSSPPDDGSPRLDSLLTGRASVTRHRRTRARMARFPPHQARARSRSLLVTAERRFGRGQSAGSTRSPVTAGRRPAPRRHPHMPDLGSHAGARGLHALRVGIAIARRRVRPAAFPRVTPESWYAKVPPFATVGPGAQEGPFGQEAPPKTTSRSRAPLELIAARASLPSSRRRALGAACSARSGLPCSAAH